MIAVTRDAAWAARLRALAARGGGPFAAFDAPPSSRDASPDQPVVVLDKAAAGGSPARAVSGLRKLYPAARVALACAEAELGVDGIAAGLASGADEVLAKSWPDARLAARLSALRDAALAEAVRVSADGALKAELRSRRAFVKSRARWTELPLPAAEFALLWALLGAGDAPAPRALLLDALRSASGREVEIETVARRALSLRRALAPWKGTVESVRGGFYRLASSRRRSIT